MGTYTNGILPYLGTMYPVPYMVSDAIVVKMGMLSFFPFAWSHFWGPHCLSHGQINGGEDQSKKFRGRRGFIVFHTERIT